MVALTKAGPSCDDIVAWQSQRETAQGTLVASMRRIKEVYNGDLVIALPELDRDPEPAVANIIAQGLDQLAGRITSVIPNLMYLPTKIGFEKTDEEARIRTRINQAWWAHSNMPKRMIRRGRHYVGYGSAPVTLTPEFKTGAPQWKYRDPLNTFPLISDDPDDMTPLDCIFKFQRSYGWLVRNYPDEVKALHTGLYTPTHDTQFTILEYNDADVMVQLVVGDQQRYSISGQPAQVGSSAVELHRLPNKAGVCLAVTPGRIGLDRRMGLFDSTIGMYKAQAKTFALEMIAAQRNVFASTFLVSRPNENAEFVSGPHDPASGFVNIVKGGEIQQSIPPQSQQAAQLGDRLERNQRVTAGIDPAMGGESQTNVRTGKRGDSIMDAVTSVPIQEAQNVFAESLMHENKRAVAIAKGFFGERKVSFYIPSGPNKGPVSYKAKDAFEDDNNVVTYPAVGTDVNSLTILLGQLRGMEMISAYTAMEMHPMISDPLEEQRRVDVEALTVSLKAGIEAQAQQGAIPPEDIAAMIKYRMGGKDVVDAVLQAHKDAQARQATIAPPPAEGQASAPEANPGISQPDQGTEQPTVAPAPQSLMNATDMLRQLRMGQRESPPERAG